MNGFDEAEFGARRIVPKSLAGAPAKKEGGGRKAGKGKNKRSQGRKRRAKSGKSKRLEAASKRKAGSDERTGSAVLVPLDQWTRVLNQLGNLHEAGQQIGEARERAARAETEAAFLRERLKEMRAELEVLKRTDPGGL